MIRSACLIFNPVSGQSDPDQDLSAIQTVLEAEIDLDVQFTTEETNAGELARAAIERGVEALIAAGGDGTLSEVAEAAIGTQIPVGIISRGTANAFANALNIPDTLDEACETILQGTTRTVDAARCNGQQMVLLAGIGFEAETIEGASREVKNRFGILAYILSGLQQLRELEQFEVELETEEKTIKAVVSAVTVANAAPPTSVLAQGPAGIIPDDGLLDITLVAPVNRAGAVAASYHLLQSGLRGEAAERNDIGYLRAPWVKISTDPVQPVAVDGELFGETPLEVECIPKSLMLFVPAEQLPEDSPPEKLDELPDVEVKLKNSNS
ncbi:MAG: YegS/Rv2252/BmrU family lipid kinase [Cyanobacteriota bacterium]|nr:YegS/Rv2252/BmrU family lipid kinase [Cyanobacteriota bacterium]